MKIRRNLALELTTNKRLTLAMVRMNIRNGRKLVKSDEAINILIDAYNSLEKTKEEIRKEIKEELIKELT